MMSTADAGRSKVSGRNTVSKEAMPLSTAAGGSRASGFEYVEMQEKQGEVILVDLDSFVVDEKLIQVLLPDTFGCA